MLFLGISDLPQNDISDLPKNDISCKVFHYFSTYFCTVFGVVFHRYFELII